DFSGQGNTGTLTNGPTWTTSGRLGKALSFDGSNDYVNVGTPSVLSITSNLTISLWFKISSLTVANNPHLAGKGYNGTNTAYGFGFNQLGIGPSNNTGALSIATYNGVANGAYTSRVFSSSDNNWTHAVAVWDGSQWRLYVNGVQDTNTQGTQTAPYSSTAKFYIGAQDSNGSNIRFFNGLIDEVRIYNRALSAAEVLQLYNSK
ncbi:MAG: LamG domain-containing protein, partial [Parcubacteria group bacterium]|nr:LamG domain-containing protein [Parcubacteria group bacterium]